jgi:predicted GNAT superfamily acetyltransferase
MSISIRPLKNVAECEHVEAISLAAWGGGYRATVPDHLLITHAKNNGVVLLAWDGDLAVGFCFSFPTFTGAHIDGSGVQWKHCSHMAAVLPSHHGRGIGEQLKWAQRAAVLAQGIKLITWTYDPLESVNAYLNLRKLGAVCNTYQRNVYGELDDDLNQGMETDRFQVDWWLDSAEVSARREGIQAISTENIPLLNQVKTKNGLLWPLQLDLGLVDSAETQLLVTIPNNIQTIKQRDIDLAHAWRTHTRILFEHAFAAGYSATDLQLAPTHASYLLQHRS